MALDPIYDMLFQDGTGNPVFITDLSNLPRQINYLKAAINLFGQNIAILHGFDKNEDGSYTPGIILYKGVMYSYPGESIPAGSYLHSREILYGERVAENGVIYNAFKRYEFVANDVDTGDDLITSEPLTDDYVMKLKSAPIGPQMIATDMLKDKSVTSAKLADGAVTAEKLAEQPIVNRGAASDLNNATNYGFYTYDATTKNTPTSYGSIIVVEGTGLAGNWIQLALGYSAGNVNPSVFVRFRQSLVSWSDWVKVWKSNDFDPNSKFGLSGIISDLNDAPLNAVFSTNGTPANAPLENAYFQGFTFAMGNNPNFKRQWAFKDKKIWFRDLYAGSWSAWTDVIPLDNYLPLSGGKTITGDVGLAAGKRLIEDGRNIIGRFAFGDDESLRTIIGANIYEVLLISTAAIKRNTGGVEYTLWDSGNFNPTTSWKTAIEKTETSFAFIYRDQVTYDISNIPVDSGSYRVTNNSSFTGSLFIFHANASNSGLGFYRPGGSNSRPQLLIGLDDSPSKWANLGEVVIKRDLENYLSKENTTVYVPTGEYNPATKGYVDSAVENGSMKKVNTTNLNTLISEGTCFFQFAASTTNAPMPRGGGGLQIVLADKIIQFVTIFYSTSYAGPSFYRTSNTASASTFSPWSCFAETSDFGQNVYFEQQLDATHFNDAPVVKKLVKGSYTNKYGTATVALDNYSSTRFPGRSSQYAPIAFRGYAKFTNYSTKETLAIVPVNSQSNNNYAFFTYVNPSLKYQVVANFTGGSASVQEQVDYLVEITYGKVV